MPGRANVILFPNPKAASATDARGRPVLDDVGDSGDCTDLLLVLLDSRPSLRATRCHEATEVQLVCFFLSQW